MRGERREGETARQWFERQPYDTKIRLSAREQGEALPAELVEQLKRRAQSAEALAAELRRRAETAEAQIGELRRRVAEREAEIQRLRDQLARPWWKRRG